LSGCVYVCDGSVVLLGMAEGLSAVEMWAMRECQLRVDYFHKSAYKAHTPSLSILLQ
jgi:hypothetical protein